MKKVIIVFLAFIVMIPVFSQNQYVLHVSAEWMAAFATPISFTGDYEGTATTSFDIGPYNQPFTVTLTILEEYENALAANLKFVKWNIADDDSFSVTVTVDDTNPEGDAIAWYANLEPTPLTLPDDSIGTVWLEPSRKTVSVGSAFEWEVHVNTGDQLLAAYDMDIAWPVPRGGNFMTVDTSIGIDGVEPGPDGYMTTVGVVLPGIITISGFLVQGAGPSNDLHLCTIHFIAGSQAMSGATVDLKVDALVDDTITDIGIPTGIGGTIIIEDFMLGDVNEDGAINIVDALLVAQYYVQLNPAGYTAPVEAGDSDQDGDVDIIDALMIAQYYVGICACPYFPPKK